MRQDRFNFNKIQEYYFLFLSTAEMNVRACEGQMTDIEYYHDLYNDLVYDIPYRLFLKKLRKLISEVTLLTEEHEQEITLYFSDLLNIMPPKTKIQIEKIISGPFDLKRFRKEKKNNRELTAKFIKEFFIER